MQCEKCGAENKDGSLFCRKCGEPLLAQNKSAEDTEKVDVHKRKITGFSLLTIVLLIAAISLVAYMNTGSRLVRSQLSQGDKYLSQQKYDEAAELYRKMLENDDKCEAAYIGLAKAYLRLGDAGRAIEGLSEGAAVLPDSEEIRDKIDEVLSGESDKQTEDMIIPTDNGYFTNKASLIPDTDKVETGASYDPSKQLSYDEYTIDGIHIDSGFGNPISVESDNYVQPENVTSALANQEFLLKEYYDGFLCTITGVYYTDYCDKFYTITDSKVTGPRNIKIGDTFESVLNKFPDTVTQEFDTSLLGLDDGEMLETISSGAAEMHGFQYPSAVFLVTDSLGNKRLCCYMLVNGMEYTYYQGLEVVFENSVVSSIKIQC